MAAFSTIAMIALGLERPLATSGLKPSVPRPRPKRPRGRPRKPRPPETIAGGPARSKKPVGRPPLWDAPAMLALVERRRDEAVQAGRKRPLRGTVLCEAVAEVIEEKARRGDDGFPDKLRKLNDWREHFQDRYSPRIALRRALKQVCGAHLAKIERELSYALTGRPTRK